MYLEMIFATSFFDSLNRLRKDGKITKDNFQFFYAGSCHERILALAREYDVQDIVHAGKPIPFSLALETLKKIASSTPANSQTDDQYEAVRGGGVEYPFLSYDTGRGGCRHHQRFLPHVVSCS